MLFLQEVVEDESDYLDDRFAYRAHGDMHSGDGKVFPKNWRSQMTQILEAPPSSVNQSSCYKQYTISGLSLGTRHSRQMCSSFGSGN